jgi:hypothetical protein
VPLRLPPDSIVVYRDPLTGLTSASLSRRVVHHSPTGCAWGDGGAGPAVLARYVLDAFLPPGVDGRETVRCHDGNRVSASAWEPHQAFTREVIARVPRAGGVIPGDVVRAWIAGRGVLSAAERARLRAVRDRFGPDEGRGSDLGWAEAIRRCPA